MEFGNKRPNLIVIVMSALLVVLLSFTSVAVAQEDQEQQQTGDAEEMARRDFASVEARQHIRQRDLTQFDDPQVRERWCSDDWIVAGGETLSHIVIACNIPLINLLAVNPQVDSPDLLYPGEMITLPDRDRDFSMDNLTAEQQDYMGRFTVAQVGEGIPVTGEELVVEAGRRNIATAQQRQMVRDRDLTRFDDPEYRERWCQDDWILAEGESLSTIVLNCKVPLTALLAANPQIGTPDLVFAGEIITIPDDHNRVDVTEQQSVYLQENFQTEFNEGEDDEDDDG
jgi:hypothetical protein